MPFQFQSLDIEGVILIKPIIFFDDRGFFMETFKRTDFEAHGIPSGFVQINYSHSSKGVLRGVHYQKNPRAQGKLVMVISGEIYDVAVDIRKGSPTFGKWVGQTLSAENHHMLYVPPGFAHGFFVISDEVDVLYSVTGGEYELGAEAGIIWDDPDIGISWPTDSPILSEKDAILPRLQDADNNFVYEGSESQ